MENRYLRSSYHTLFKNIAHVVPTCNFDWSCICVFVHLCICIWGLSDWIVHVMGIVHVVSFRKIHDSYGRKCPIVEIWRDVTLVSIAVSVFFLDLDKYWYQKQIQKTFWWWDKLVFLCHACGRMYGRTDCEDRAIILETEFAKVY